MSRKGLSAESQRKICAARAATLPTLSGTLSVKKSCEIKLEDIQDFPLKKGDEIILESMGLSSNYWIVSNPKEMQMYENDLAKMMKIVEMFAKPVVGSALVKGQIVAARWTKDEKMYRAIIHEINTHLGKVKVTFIDYGNQSIEPMKHLFELPKFIASKIPILAKIIDLAAVPAIKKDPDPQIELQ